MVDGFFLVDDDEVPFKGVVAWAEPGNPQASMASRIGVRFEQLPPGLKALFATLEKRPRRLKKK